MHNPMIGARYAANGDVITEFYGENGERIDIIFTTQEAVEGASLAFQGIEQVKADLDEHGLAWVNEAYGFELDDSVDYEVVLPTLDDNFWEGEPWTN